MRKVYLVGAGPGDPALITLKGLEIIKRADVIICDRLVPKELLKRAKKGCECIYVGKRSGRHALPQEEINRLLVEKADEGRVVVRLKGGDPFVFGRGGEEAVFLREHGVECEVVPGVTSAIAVPALAGIPVTHRRYASSVTIVTGREDPEKEIKRIDYSKLKADTVVILMGLETLPETVSQMLDSRAGDTPVAVIEQGSTERERVVTGTLADIVERVKKEKLVPPAVIVIGKVVELQGDLK